MVSALNMGSRRHNEEVEMNTCKVVGVAMVAGWLVGGELALGQLTQRSSVLDSAGTRSSGGTFTNLSAAGQPGGIATSRGGSYYNQAGFLNTFFLKPGLDTDGNGVADEADWDNDGDQLADQNELLGNQFSPVTPTQVNVADSDGDGVPDGAESVAGTDPTDVDALLEIIRITPVGGQDIGWIARGGKTYVVHARTNLLAGTFTPIATNTAVGGTAPWFVTTNAIVDASSIGPEYYAVEVLP
jgi:hypothetical protein